MRFELLQMLLGLRKTGAAVEPFVLLCCIFSLEYILFFACDDRFNLVKVIEWIVDMNKYFI